MSQKYSAETREILADFLRALEEREGFNPQFLAELGRLTGAGKLGYRSEVGRAVRILEAHDHEHEN